MPGGTQHSVVVIVPEPGGKDFSPSFIMFDVAQYSFMAAVYRTEPIVRWKSFGRVQIFAN